MTEIIITQFERHLAIDRRIRGGEFPSVLGLAAEWGVDARTIKCSYFRDIDLW